MKYFLKKISYVILISTAGCTVEENPFNSIEGKIQWDRTYGGNAYWSTLGEVIITSDGGYLIGGSSADGISEDRSRPSFGNLDYWVLKLDREGNKVWDQAYGGSSMDELIAVAPTKDGGYLLGGNTMSPPSGNKTSPFLGNSLTNWIIKIDSKGNKIWEKNIGAPNIFKMDRLISTPDGGFLLAGNTPTVNSDWWIYKITSEGEQQWTKTFGGDRLDQLKDILYTQDNHILLMGNSSSSNSGDKSHSSRGKLDIWVVKTNASGEKMWDQTYGGLDDDVAYRIAQISPDNYIIAGSTLSPISGDVTTDRLGGFDYWALSINSEGKKNWDKRYGGSLDDEQTMLPIKYDGGFLLGGLSDSGISGDKTQPSNSSSQAKDYWILNLNDKQEKVWDQTIGGGGSNKLKGILTTSDGGYLLTGETAGTNTDTKKAPQKGLTSIWLVKIK